MIFVIVAILLAIAVFLFWSGMKGLIGSLGGQHADSTPQERHIPCFAGEELLKVADGLKQQKYVPEFFASQPSAMAEAYWNGDADFAELQFFAQVITEQIEEYNNDFVTKPYLIKNQTGMIIDAPDDLLAWQRQLMGYMDGAVQGFSALLNTQFPKAFGEPGQESDKQGLYELASAWAYMYIRMVYLLYRTTHARNTPQSRDVMRRLAAAFGDVVQQLADYPTQLLAMIDEQMKNPQLQKSLSVVFRPYVDQKKLDAVRQEVIKLCKHWNYDEPLDPMPMADVAVPSVPAYYTESANPNTNPNATNVNYILSVVFCNNVIKIQI